MYNTPFMNVTERRNVGREIVGREYQAKRTLTFVG